MPSVQDLESRTRADDVRTAVAPLSEGGIDIRDLDGFLLNVERLLSSELWALATGDEFKAAVGLWCRAWKQVPAGSLPNDERVLASFAGVSGVRWRKVRAVALRGFVLCSDGRLYHRVLCEDARRAYAAKLERRARTSAATNARRQRHNERNVDRDEHVTGSQGREGGREGEEKTGSQVVSSETFARETTATIAFSTQYQATTWASRNPQLVGPLLESFRCETAYVIDVLRHFRVKLECRGLALEEEWRRDTKGQSPEEVALVFANAPEGSIQLPSQYRAARKAFESTEPRS